jgi:hypothetical protein
VKWVGDYLHSSLHFSFLFFFYIVKFFFSKHSSGFCNMVVAHTHTDR